MPRRPAAPAATDTLPKIGAPATRALSAHGIATLADVAKHTEAELADLHGVGPKALRLLAEALAASGRSFAKTRG